MYITSSHAGHILHNYRQEYFFESARIDCRAPETQDSYTCVNSEMNNRIVLRDNARRVTSGLLAV
jgi:hypothetical protein